MFLPLRDGICAPTPQSRSGSPPPVKYGRRSTGPVSRSLETSSSFHFLSLGYSLLEPSRHVVRKSKQPAGGGSMWKSAQIGEEAASPRQHRLASHGRETSWKWTLQPLGERLRLVLHGAEMSLPNEALPSRQTGEQMKWLLLIWSTKFLG